jgi:hypothetical protein
MKRILTVVCLVSLCFVAGPAAADTKTHKASQISFWLPDDWTVEGEDRDQLEVSDPKGQVALLFMIRDAKDMKGALDAIDKVIATIATDVKVGKATKTKLNGMEAAVVDATGKTEGKAVELSVLILKTPAKKFLTVFGVLETSVKKQHEPALVKILASLKPTAKFGK